MTTRYGSDVSSTGATLPQPTFVVLAVKLAKTKGFAGGTS
jgi:hypothetical protein